MLGVVDVWRHCRLADERPVFGGIVELWCYVAVLVFPRPVSTTAFGSGGAWYSVGEVFYWFFIDLVDKKIIV